MPSSLRPGRVWHRPGKQRAGRMGNAPAGPHATHGLEQKERSKPPLIIHLRIYRGKCIE